MKKDDSSVLELEVQYAAGRQDMPSRRHFQTWARAALQGVDAVSELVIRLVDEQESRQLNHCYRGKDKATNVLSFPFEAPPGIESNHLGDLVICAALVKQEAQQQGKAELDHWAHMVVHGVLHLRGFDHETEAQAEEMETLEKQILAGLGVADPYQVIELQG